MTDQQGKFSIGAILLLLILVYGGFLAVKFTSAGFTASQIENEIKESLFLRQGSDFTPEKGKKAIRDILDKKGVYYDEDNEDIIVVTIDSRTYRITYYVEYEIDINLIFFKKTKFVTLDKILGR
jgi:anionic cell wall polymer biosynthesis LytR-Cps2A-Psr (LCP) family protein